MKRVLRWARDGLTVASLAVSVAALATWPLSYLVGGFLIAQHQSGTAHPAYAWWGADLAVGRGGLGVYLHATADSADRPADSGDVFEWRPHPDGPTYPDQYAPGRPQVDWRWFQAGYDTGLPPIYPGRSAWLTAPLWAWALAFGLLPGWRAVRWHRRRQHLWRPGPAFEVVGRPAT